MTLFIAILQEPITRETRYRKQNKVWSITIKQQKKDDLNYRFVTAAIKSHRNKFKSYFCELVFVRSSAETCSICGISHVHAQCFTCAQRLCLNCDKLFHSHPDRKGHNRNILTPAKTSRWGETQGSGFISVSSSFNVIFLLLRHFQSVSVPVGMRSLHHGQRDASRPLHDLRTTSTRHSGLQRSGKSGLSFSQHRWESSTRTEKKEETMFKLIDLK